MDQIDPWALFPCVFRWCLIWYRPWQGIRYRHMSVPGASVRRSGFALFRGVPPSRGGYG
jgi:hypothetical protein